MKITTRSLRAVKAKIEREEYLAQWKVAKAWESKFKLKFD